VARVVRVLFNFLSLSLSFMKKIIFFLFVGLFLTSCTTSGDYTNLTSCLAEKKVVMFGASWCPHCAEQKKMFGRSAKNMPYFECAK
jgi:thiol-disulfide isomerase/thioredoxin